MIARTDGGHEMLAKEERDRLVMENVNLVWSLARKIKRPMLMALEDLAQEGITAIIAGSDRFDPSYGVKFCTWAGNVAYRAMVKYATANRSAITVPCFDMSHSAELQCNRTRAYSILSLSPWNESDRQKKGRDIPAPRKESSDGEVRSDAEVILKRCVRRRIISARERNILRMRSEGVTLKEIGIKEGVCKERIRQIERKALKKLRAKLK